MSDLREMTRDHWLARAIARRSPDKGELEGTVAVAIAKNATISDIIDMQNWCDENITFSIDSLDKLRTWKGRPRDPWYYSSGSFYFVEGKSATLFALKWL